MITVGQKVRFMPLYDAPAHIEVRYFKQIETTGTVTAISEHGWFLVEYEANGTTLRTTFRFEDIEEGKVKICGK